MREISRPGSASGTSGVILAFCLRRDRTSAAGTCSTSLRGAPVNSSIDTCSACATFASTVNVGFAAPVSRLAQVGLGNPESPAICCCDMLCALRSRFTFAARFRLISSMPAN
jgi:hypothetical protein